MFTHKRGQRQVARFRCISWLRRSVHLEISLLLNDNEQNHGQGDPNETVARQEPGEKQIGCGQARGGWRVRHAPASPKQSPPERGSANAPKYTPKPETTAERNNRTEIKASATSKGPTSLNGKCQSAVKRTQAWVDRQVEVLPHEDAGKYHARLDGRRTSRPQYQAEAYWVTDSSKPRGNVTGSNARERPRQHRTQQREEDDPRRLASFFSRSARRPASLYPTLRPRITRRGTRASTSC